jgi:hypothetical protein
MRARGLSLGEIARGCKIVTSKNYKGNILIKKNFYVTKLFFI